MPPPTNSETDSPAPDAGHDPLAEIDRIMQRRKDVDRRADDANAQLIADRARWSADFSTACARQVRPAMEAIIERLHRQGGGGVVEERAADAAAEHDHRLILWMSMSGDMVGAPRQDRNPYLQLDADVDGRRVTVSEGDLWEEHSDGRGGHVGTWELSQLTADRVTNEVIAILHRAVP